MTGAAEGIGICPGVVPVLVGPLQVLLTILPGLLVALAGGLLGLFKPAGLKNALLLLWRQKIAVAGMACVGIGLYFSVKTLWPSSGAGLITTAQLGSDWPTTRFDLRRTGAVPGSPSPSRPSLNWTFRFSDEGFIASPAVVGNRVYISSAQLGAFSKSGKIYCFDADTGAIVWSNGPPDYRATFSSPVVAGDYLVCGEGLHDTRDARVVCLDVRDQGKVLWTFRTNNHVECTPVVANGRVYVGAGDDGYYCLDLKPGADGQPKLHWHLPTEQYPDAETSLAVHDGKVYAGLGNKGAALVVLDALSGSELQRVKMPYPVFSPVSIADGKLYLGMGDGDYVKSGEGGEVRCLDLKTLKTLWTYPLPQTVLGAIAVTDDKLYFGCNDGHLYCLTRDGALVKSFNTFAPIKTSPAVTEQHVFTVGDKGRLLALDRHTLEPVWEFPLGTEGFFISSPVVARGHVYVGTQTEGLLCVGKPASSKQSPQWFAPLGGPGVAGNSDNSPLPEAGEVNWTYANADKKAFAAAVPPIAVWQEHLYVPSVTLKGWDLRCLVLDKEGQGPPRPLWTFKTRNILVHSPVVLGKTVACVDGAVEGRRRQVYFINRLTGNELARHELSPEASGLITGTPHQFLVQDGVQTLSSFDENGGKRWTAPVGSLACAPVANDALILAIGREPREALVLDRDTGIVLWRQPLTHLATAAPLLEKARFLLPTSDGLETRSLIDGQLLTSWKAEAGVPTGELALLGTAIVFVNDNGEVIAFDRTSGKVTARVPGALRGQTPLVSRGKVIYAAPGRLMTFALGQENITPELWLDLSAQTPPDAMPTGPLVLRDSAIFTVLPGRGLTCLGRPK